MNDRTDSMPLAEVIETILRPALLQLPPFMTSDRAELMVLTTGAQETNFMYRRQMGNGPARGFWQFELGTRASRGGVWGVYLHQASAPHLRMLCALHKVDFLPEAIHAALEFDDVFACGVARLLLLTDAAPLPQVGDVQGAWRCYAERTWRPGKPHPEKWPGYYQASINALGL